MSSFHAKQPIRTLVTGASGFTGRYLVDNLLGRAAHQVMAAAGGDERRQLAEREVVAARDPGQEHGTQRIGAAHPVQVSSTGSVESPPDDTMKQKLENYAVGYIETIATKRKRNVEWAKSSVKESATITAEITHNEIAAFRYRARRAITSRS